MAQIKEPPRTEVIDAVINLFSRYTGSGSSGGGGNDTTSKTSLTTSSSKVTRSVASSSVHTASTHPPHPKPAFPPPSSSSVSSSTLRLQHESESKDDYIHQLNNENSRLTSLLHTTSAKLEDTITILSQKAHGWLDLEKSMEQQKHDYAVLHAEYDKEVLKNQQLQLTIDELRQKLLDQENYFQQQLHNLTVTHAKLNTPPPPPSPPKPEPLPLPTAPTVSLASYKALETELNSLRTTFETEKSHHHDYRQRYERLMQKYQQEIAQYQQEIDKLQHQLRYSSQHTTALVEQLRKDNEYLSKLNGIDHYTTDSHYLRSPNDITPHSYLDPQVWQPHQPQTQNTDLISLQVHAIGGNYGNDEEKKGYEEDIGKLQSPQPWSDAPTWVPTDALLAAHELYLSCPASSSVQDSYTFQKFLLRTNQAYYDKLLAILKKQEKIFKKKLAWRVPFQEVLQASTITRLRSTVTTLQSLVQGRNPPPNAAFGATTVDRDNATPGELAFGRHDTYNQHSNPQLSLNSLQDARSRTRSPSPGKHSRNSVSPSKARLLSVPGSGGKRLDGYESAQLLVQAMECVEFLQNKIKQLENDVTVSRASSPLNRSRGVSPAPPSIHNGSTDVSKSPSVKFSPDNYPPSFSSSPVVASPVSQSRYSPNHLPSRTFRTASPSILSPGPGDTLRTLPVDGTVRRTPQVSHTFTSPNVHTAVTRKSPSTPPLEVRDAILASQSPLQYTAGLSNRQNHPGTW